MSTMTAPVSAAAKKDSCSASPTNCQCITPSRGNEITADRIRARAYEIYQVRNGNGGAGDAASDWAQAERELNGSASRTSVTSDIEMKAQARGEKLLASGST